MERYRSGHNGTDSKSVVPSGTVGSNPTHSAKKSSKQAGLLDFSFLLVCSKSAQNYGKNRAISGIFAYLNS